MINHVFLVYIPLHTYKILMRLRTFSGAFREKTEGPFTASDGSRLMRLTPLIGYALRGKY